MGVLNRGGLDFFFDELGGVLEEGVGAEDGVQDLGFTVLVALDGFLEMDDCTLDVVEGV